MSRLTRTTGRLSATDNATKVRGRRLVPLYFHLYGLTRQDAAHILSTFPIVQRKDEARHGTYRTRDLILSYYDAYGRGDMEAWFGRDEEREARQHSSETQS